MEKASNSYILEISWGCPSEKYPIHGVFQFDQAKALADAGERVVFLALDLRSFRKWRKWGVSKSEYKGMTVYEYSFPCGPMPPAIKYRIQDHGFKQAIRAITRDCGQPALMHIHTCQQAISETDYCAEHNIPYIITEHITPLDETAPIEQRKRDALHGAARVICVSNALGRDIKRVYDVDSITIPNIVDLSEFKYVTPDSEQEFTHSFSLAVRETTDTHITRILSAARIDHGKGFDILIRAYAQFLKKHPDAHLTIMGDGPELSAIRDLSTELGIRNTDAAPGGITFTGAYHRREFARALAQTDFFVLPSRSETFGIVYVEAMAAGVPVIATSCGGPEDFVNDDNGILVPVDDIPALTEAMCLMADKCSSYDRGFISDSCRKRFSAEAVSGMLTELFKSVTEGR